MRPTGHIMPLQITRTVERLTEGPCPHCGLIIIRGDTVAVGRDERIWHVGCIEQMARDRKRGRRMWGTQWR